MAIPKNKLSYFRKHYKLTQFDVLDEIFKATGKKFRQATISSWETGKSVPDMEILQVLAALFKVKMDDLYENPNEDQNEASTLPSESELRAQITEIQQQYKAGNKEEAFQKLADLSNYLVSEACDISDQYSKLKSKLKTAQDVLKL